MVSTMDEETVLQCLRRHFYFGSFRSELQKDAVMEVCQRKCDVLISMPTGSGKSLCYQLPALLHPGKVTLVFSPLLALVKDQIDHLLKLRIRAATINSKSTKAEREAVVADLKSTSPNLKILYVTPEQAATFTFKELYQNLCRFDKVAYLVVDEAHCVSEWGHDFRPHYRKLAELRENVDIPCVALTATANADVTKDIKENLKLGKLPLKVFKSSCFRDNLYYDVFYPNVLDEPYKHLVDFIKKSIHNEENVTNDMKSCGIIYCRTREQTEMLMERLNKMGVKTLCYHAGLKSHERKIFQEKWQNGEVPVMCATISFGMGVDKSTVRFIIHWGSPKDPASYYQETGRAGRDGKPAKCRVYYSRTDSKAIEFHLTQDLGKAGSNELKRKRAEQAIKDFKKILQYCENPIECRHRLFSNHFGEPPPKCVNACDFCTNKKAVQEMSELFLTKSIQFSTRAEGYSDTDFSDLYGGGRPGMDEGGNGYDSDDNSSAFELEQKSKKATEDFIQKQFALRRNPHEVSQSTVDKLFSKHSRVKAAAATSSKIKGLTLPTREQYVTRLSDILNTNYTECQEEPTLDKKDIEDCAVDVEYDIFSSNTSMTMYRSAMVKIFTEIKKCTSDKIVHESLLTFEPKPAKFETITDLFRNIKKDQQVKDSGFSTASEVLASKRGGQSKIKDFFKDGKTDGKMDLFGDEDKTEEGKADSWQLFGNEDREREEPTFRDLNTLGSENEEKASSNEENGNNTNFYSLFQNKARSTMVSFGNDNSSINNKNFFKSKDTITGNNLSSFFEQKTHRNLKNLFEYENKTDEKNSKNLKTLFGDDSPDEDSKKESDKEKPSPRGYEEYKKRSHSKDITEDRHKRKKLDTEHTKKTENGESSKSYTGIPDKTTSAAVNPKPVFNPSGVSLENTMEEMHKDLPEASTSKPKTTPKLKPRKLKKTEIGVLVVSLLTPAYSERRFESRQVFKDLARTISHALAEESETSIIRNVKYFLRKNNKITSETKFVKCKI